MYDVGSYPVTYLFESRTYRLIDAVYYTTPLREALTELQDDSVSNYSSTFRLYRSNLNSSSPRNTLTSNYSNLASRSYIDAAFQYTSRGGNRFNDSSRGAWYCAQDISTAINEIGFHITSELSHLDDFKLSKEFQVLLAGIVGTFHDVRNLTRGEGILHEDKEIAYPLGQELARKLVSRNSNGIVYPSVRDINGTCFVAFRPEVVQRVRDGGRWLLTWNGSPAYTAKQVKEE